MAGSLYTFFANDHRRLEVLLNKVVVDVNSVDTKAYAEFRGGLLRHISMEEKVLLPAARTFRGGQPHPLAAKIRLDHGALASLLVPPPSSMIVGALRAILADHNKLEEMPGGLYESCESLAGNELECLLEKVHSIPEVPVVPNNPKPYALEATRRALARAGYDLDNYSSNH